MRTGLFDVMDTHLFQFSDPNIASQQPWCPTSSMDDSAGVPSTSGSSVSWPSMAAEPSVIFKRRQEGAILALLKHRPSGKDLLVGATHLFWDPKYAGVKSLQAATLCQQASSFLQRRYGQRGMRDVPVIIGGDFNSLWRKYVPDTFTPKVTPTCMEACSSAHAPPASHASVHNHWKESCLYTQRRFRSSKSCHR